MPWAYSCTSDDGDYLDFSSDVTGFFIDWSFAEQNHEYAQEKWDEFQEIKTQFPQYVVTDVELGLTDILGISMTMGAEEDLPDAELVGKES